MGNADWTKIKVSGTTVAVISFGLIGLLCGAIWSGLMMAPKDELRQSDYIAMHVFAILTLVSLVVSFAVAFRQIRRVASSPTERATRLKRGWLGLGGIVAAFALGLIFNVIAAPGGLTFIPTGLILAGLIALISAMQAEF